MSPAVAEVRGGWASGMADVYDVVVIGAGLYGIQAARTYLEIHPSARLIVIESDEDVGGVWSRRRVYSTFISQTPTSMSQFSDMPLALSSAERQRYHPFCHAKHIAEYLDRYVRSHVYNDSTLHDRINFNTRVEQVTHQDNPSKDHKWIISCSRLASDDEESTFVIRTRIVLDCTGLSSQPLIPKIPGQETFNGVQIHQKQFAAHENNICAPSKLENDNHVVIIGGAKSAADVVYTLAKQPHLHVSWIIRRSGNGPAAFLPAKGAERFYTRLVAGFLPCVFGKRSWWEGLVHRTRIGRWIVAKVWERVDKRYRSEARFDRADGKANGFAGLESETPVFWQNDSSGINQRDDFWDVIAAKVHVYRNDIATVEPESIVLAAEADGSGLSIRANVIIHCTGWSSTSSILNTAVAETLGLPTITQRKQSLWHDLALRADQEVLHRFPMLKYPPPYDNQSPSHTPFYLFNTMVPTSKSFGNSILFLGRLVVGNNFLVAEAQALWAIAYLDEHMNFSHEEMNRKVAETIAWSRRRYLNKGQSGVWCYFDVVNYVDMLLGQVGLQSHRRSSWIRTLLTPLQASNFSCLIDEYKRSRVSPNNLAKRSKIW